LSRIASIGHAARTRLAPLLIWVGTMGVAAWLYLDIGGKSPVIGFATAPEYNVACLDPGRVDLVAVELGQSVVEGQVVARLEGGELDAEIRVEEAQLERVKAAIRAEEAKASQGVADLERSLVESVADAERAHATTASKHHALEAELKAVRAKLRELVKLVEQGVATRNELTSLEIREAALAGEVAEGGRTVRVLDDQLKAARTRGMALPQDSVAIARAPLEREREVIEAGLGQLRARHQNLVLVAPASGTVAAVLKRAGEVVGTGEPIVKLVGLQSDRVVACVSELEAQTVAVGALAEMWPRGRRGEPLTGQVVSLGPIVDQVPTRCRRDPNQPAWGRDVVILLDRPARLVSGQAFDVALKNPEPIDGAMAAEAALPADAPQKVGLPADLAARTRFEPSGLTWVPALSRYVIVSDDTGQKEHQEHAPWLFTMDIGGNLDPEPLVLHGVDEVRDLEAVTQGRGGVLYVLSSQAFSKTGKRKESREAFLRLAPEGPRYTVTARVSLASLLEAEGPAGLAALGLEDTQGLDIEGLASHQEGLLIGLKAPVTADGKAIIWRMESPEAFFVSGHLKDGGLRLWARVALSVTADGRTVPGGISDLVMLPEGALVLTATASGLRPKQQTGSLWRVAAPTPGELTAVRVRVFDGLKPEGVALAPQPGELAIIFDTGLDTPLWLRLPWPRI
jgi:multidrug resistance efflux pump